MVICTNTHMKQFFVELSPSHYITIMSWKCNYNHGLSFQILQNWAAINSSTEVCICFNALLSVPCLQRCVCVLWPSALLANMTIKRVRQQWTFFKTRITIVHIILGFIITLCVKTDVTYRCNRMVDQETVEVEILDIPCKVHLTNSICLCDLEVFSELTSHKVLCHCTMPDLTYVSP